MLPYLVFLTGRPRFALVMLSSLINYQINPLYNRYSYIGQKKKKKKKKFFKTKTKKNKKNEI